MTVGGQRETTRRSASDRYHSIKRATSLDIRRAAWATRRRNRAALDDEGVAPDIDTPARRAERKDPLPPIPRHYNWRESGRNPADYGIVLSRRKRRKEKPDDAGAPTHPRPPRGRSASPVADGEGISRPVQNPERPVLAG